MSSSKGLFIAFEGIDGCGKSTQARIAEERLKAAGVPAILTREPGGTPISERIRGIILDPASPEMDNTCEVLLYLAARAQHVAERIRPALSAGMVVLCDRFSAATLAYQGYGRGLPLQRLADVDSFATGRLAPEHTFVFDITVEEARRRMRKAGKRPDRLERNPADFHDRIRAGYLSLAAGQSERFTVLDGSWEAERLADAVEQRIRLMLRRTQEAPGA